MKWGGISGNTVQTTGHHTNNNEDHHDHASRSLDLLWWPHPHSMSAPSAQNTPEEI